MNYKYSLQFDVYIWNKNNSTLLQYSDMKSFQKNYYSIETSIKIFKDNSDNKVIIIKSEPDNQNLEIENFSPLGEIIKEGEKYYFIPFINELGNERETIKDVPWMIYSKKSEPEINSVYYLKEGDIIKLGNAIFKVQMINMSNLDNINNNNYNYNYEENDDNNTLMMVGSSNQSLILNGKDNLDNIESLKTQKIILYQNNKEKTEEKQIDKIEIKSDINKEKTKNKICRICYQEEDDSLINPLIKPCKCSGSMKYIHIKCLLFWLKSRTIRHQNNVLEHNDFFNSYYINKETQCELCKELFPDYIKHNHIKYCLIDLDYMQEIKIKKSTKIPAQNYVNTNNELENNNLLNNGENNPNSNPNFIVLDTIFPLNDGNKYRSIVKFNKNNQILIGRGLENQLVLNEITVSRTHCLLTLQRNKFGKKELKLEDDGSKFGTLVLLQSNRYEIIKGKPLHVQINNIYIVMKIPVQKSILSCCNVDVLDGKNSYEKVNSQAVKNKYKVNVLTEGNSDDEKENDNYNINDNKSESVNNINRKNTENNNANKISQDIKYKNKEEIKNEEKEEKKEEKEYKDEIILYEIKKEDLLILKDKAKNNNNKEKIKKIKKEKENKENKDDKDKDKRTVIIPNIKGKELITNHKEENKMANTTPENIGINKKLLEIKSIKLNNKESKKEQQESNKDIESIIIVEDGSEKN